MSAKPLPAGYVCKLCGGTDHAVYDCALKKKRKELKTDPDDSAPKAPSSSSGGEKKSKKIKFDSGDGGDESAPEGDNSSSTNTTVHLSGLPFDTTKQSLEDYLRKEDADEGLLPLSHHSLKYFEDSPKRCKGVAYLVFSCEEFASNAIKKLNGRVMGTLELRAAILIEKKKASQPKVSQPKGRSEGEGEKTPRCYRCGGKDHGSKECTKERVCYRCMGTDHLAAQCPKRQQVYNIKK